MSLIHQHAHLLITTLAFNSIIHTEHLQILRWSLLTIVKPAIVIKNSLTLQ